MSQCCLKVIVFNTRHLNLPQGPPNTDSNIIYMSHATVPLLRQYVELN